MSQRILPERLTSLLIVSWTRQHEIHEAASRLAILIEEDKGKPELLGEVRAIASFSELPLPIVRLVKLLQESPVPQ